MQWATEWGIFASLGGLWALISLVKNPQPILIQRFNSLCMFIIGGLLTWKSFSSFSAPDITLWFDIALFSLALASLWAIHPFADAQTFSLVAWSLTGVALVTHGQTCLRLFVGLELQVLPLYILCVRHQPAYGIRSALHYFMLNALSSCLIGMGYVFYVLHSGIIDLGELTFLQALAPHSVLFILGGCLLKIGLIPFHFWVPKVLHRHQWIMLGMVGTLGKLTVLKALVWTGLHDLWLVVTFGLCAMTMMWGVLCAWVEDDLCRLFAFSGLAQSGWMVAALWTMEPHLAGFYCSLYGLSLWGVIAYALHTPNTCLKISHWQGWIRKDPYAFGVLTLCLLSLAGLPPLGGMFPKFFLLVQWAYTSNFIMMIGGALAALGSVAYTLRLIGTMLAPSTSSLLPALARARHIQIAIFGVLLPLVLGWSYAFSQHCSHNNGNGNGKNHNQCASRHATHQNEEQNSQRVQPNAVTNPNRR